MKTVIWRALAGAVFLCGGWFMARGQPPALTWDALEKNFTAKVGDTEAVFVFTATNRSDHPVEIKRLATSCHCTVAEPPRKPWIIAPGGVESLAVKVDLTGRRGLLNKTIYVETEQGDESLLVHVDVPPPPAIQREMNQELAIADRQATLRGDCATCHVTPTVGKIGAELFATACLICHKEHNRASMVPDLMQPTVKRDAAYWETMIREGREKTLMPAFEKARGGSLDDGQIKSLVEFLLKNLPTEPVAPAAAPTAK